MVTMSLTCGSDGSALMKYTSRGRNCTPSRRSMKGNDHVHVVGDRDAPGHAQQRADDADQRALHQEDARHFARPGAQRAQDGDVGLLVLTAITSEDSRLNAATATISARIRNIMRWS